MAFDRDDYGNRTGAMSRRVDACSANSRRKSAKKPLQRHSAPAAMRALCLDVASSPATTPVKAPRPGSYSRDGGPPSPLPSPAGVSASPRLLEKRRSSASLNATWQALLNEHASREELARGAALCVAGGAPGRLAGRPLTPVPILPGLRRTWRCSPPLTRAGTSWARSFWRGGRASSRATRRGAPVRPPPATPLPASRPRPPSVSGRGRARVPRG